MKGLSPNSIILRIIQLWHISFDIFYLDFCSVLVLVLSGMELRVLPLPGNSSTI
jgi:hypothetical protein